MTCHLCYDTSYQIENYFRKQAFEITTWVLDFIENTFNSFPNPIKPTIKFLRILVSLVGSFGSIDAVSEFENIAIENNYSEINLSVMKENNSAISFYEKLGWSINKAIEDTYTMTKILQSDEI